MVDNYFYFYSQQEFLDKELQLLSINSLHLNLDYYKSTYNDIVDYEVELEETSLQHAHENLKAICEQVGIQYRLNELSKQARAMNSLKK